MIGISVFGSKATSPWSLSFAAMTPDSIISYQRSLPSRVRSPTPANTE